MKKKEKKNWVWMPHAGHFIAGNKCNFHLSTKVGKYLVSTVGEYWPDRVSREIHAKIYDQKWYLENVSLLGDYFDSAYMKRFGFEEIGLNRTFETMVFRAVKDKENKCCPYTANDWDNIDFCGYKTAADAYKGHLKICDKWSKK